MNVLNTIFQILISLPKIFELVQKILDLIKGQQEAAKRSEQEAALEELKKAQTIEEIKRANKEIASKLP